jgi:hypothetical protein
MLLLQGTLLASFREESKARLQVLRRLGHVAGDGTVLLKGRAACEIDTADELLTVGESFALLGAAAASCAATAAADDIMLLNSRAVDMADELLTVGECPWFKSLLRCFMQAPVLHCRL